jgi:uncharacterized protein (DUF2236 family)
MDEGYFPRGKSVLREVHSERLVGLHYGQRALCIGAVKPLNYVGTSLHTKQKRTPFRRLAHTAKMFETIYFGTRAEADRVLAVVHKMHSEVKGTLPEDAGPRYPKGTPYDAFDPELMLWTVAVAADSAEYFYELFVRPLSREEKEAYWQDYLRFAELFGMPRDAAPPTYADWRAWWDEQLAGDDLYLTPEARVVGSFTAFQIPLPLHLQGAKRVHDFLMLGSLPPRIRELYGLPWSRARQVAWEALVRAVRAGRLLLPGPVARGRCEAAFELVAKTERRRIQRGKPTPQVAT